MSSEELAQNRHEFFMRQALLAADQAEREGCAAQAPRGVPHRGGPRPGRCPVEGSALVRSHRYGGRARAGAARLVTRDAPPLDGGGAVLLYWVRRWVALWPRPACIPVSRRARVSATRAFTALPP